MAWLAKTRSACSLASAGIMRSIGSSTQMMPISAPPRLQSGTSSQWLRHAAGPRPLMREW